jgi:hypothetical protein
MLGFICPHSVHRGEFERVRGNLIIENHAAQICNVSSSIDRVSIALRARIVRPRNYRKKCAVTFVTLRAARFDDARDASTRFH